MTICAGRITTVIIPSAIFSTGHRAIARLSTSANAVVTSLLLVAALAITFAFVVKQE